MAEKLTQEELEAKLKRLEELEAANAAKSGTPEGSSDNSGDKTDGKKRFTDKVKDGAKAFWNYSITPKKIVTTIVIAGGAFLGFKCAYNKGHADALAESEFNGTSLPDNGEQLTLETTAEPTTVIEATVEDYAPEEVYEEE